MKLLPCPVNGLRPVSEFTYWGELREMPDPESASDTQWADYVFNRNGAGGTKKEWWCHTPSNVWFVAERNTLTDEIVLTYLVGGEGER
jgi:sarcosine oxidase subunit delta